MNDDLEQMIDQHGLTAVLEAIAKVCGEKAEHVQTNWQDGNLAKLWTKRMIAIDLCATKVARLG